MNKSLENFKIHYTKGCFYKRFGNTNDGGYVFVDDIKNTDYIISAGIADNNLYSLEDNIGLELELLSKAKGIDMYDIALDSIPNLPSNAKYYKGEVGNGISLSDMLLNSGEHLDYILKMDIESSEYAFLLKSSTEDLKKFRQICIEFHNVSSFLNFEANALVECLQKINKTHNIVLINSNNHAPLEVINNYYYPDVIEVLFLRKDSYNFIEVDRPQKLLSPCNKDAAQYGLFYNYI